MWGLTSKLISKRDLYGFYWEQKLSTRWLSVKEKVITLRKQIKQEVYGMYQRRRK